MTRFVWVTDQNGEHCAATVVGVGKTARPEAVQVTFRLPNGDTHKATMRPDAVMREGDPWGPGGKFIESGLKPVKGRAKA
ncbi:hypothetical protein [Nocardioides taihuensis]|uniref:Uncharacterized protein n=1 Tax=Nocardioides taihuensis TaxID=1835606 RepID=A0ABW0BMT1_9ACTN